MVRAVFQPHEFQRLQGVGAPLAGGPAAVDHGQFNILEDIELGQQIERLEHEPDFLIADAGQLVRGGVFDHGAVQFHRAPAG